MTDTPVKKGRPGPRYVLSLVLLLLLAILVVIFTIQNADPIEIKLFTGTAKVSLALVLFGVLLTGVLLTVLVGLPGNWRKRRQIAVLEKNEGSLRDEVSRLKAKLAAAKAREESNTAPENQPPAPE